MVFGFWGQVVGGVVGAVGGAAVGALQGDPLGGARRGVVQGGRVGGAVGGGVTSLAVGVAALPKNAAKAGFNVFGRAIEAFAFNGIFEQADRDAFARLCAFAAADVYMVRTHGPPIRGTLKVNNQSWDIECVGGQKSDGLRVALYKVDNEALIIAFRGTDTTNPSDLVRNIHIAMGCLKSSVTYIEGVGWAKSLMLHHNCSRCFVTGHSLGGALAMVFASDGKNYSVINGCHVFNPGTGLCQNDVDTSTISGALEAMGFSIPISFGSATPKIHAHHVYGDPISFLTSSSATTTVHTYNKVYGVSVHDAGNFTTSEMDNKIRQRDLRCCEDGEISDGSDEYENTMR